MDSIRKIKELLVCQTHKVLPLLTFVGHILAYIVLYLLGMVVCVIAAIPSLDIAWFITSLSGSPAPSLRFFLALSFGVISGYVMFGIVVLLISICFARILPCRGWEGTRAVKDPRNYYFLISAALLILAEHLFLPLLRGTPLLVLFYRGLGAKIGRGTIITSTRISDCDILEIGQDCIIGGDCVINGHSAEYGSYIRKKVTIGDRVTIGQYATLLPGVRVKDDVVIGANSLVPKFKQLEKGIIYGGVPVSEITRSSIQTNISVAPKTHVQVFEHTNKLPMIQPKDNLNFLLESYKLRNAEIVAIETYLTTVVVTSLTAFAGVFMYAVNGGKPQFLSFIPMLVAISGLIMCVLISGINDLGFHVAKIEKLLKKQGASYFDWELSEGAMGHGRVLRLPGIIIIILYICVYAITVYLTFWGPLLQVGEKFMDYSLRDIAVVVDVTTGLSCCLAFVNIWFQRLFLQNKLRQIPI